ncbi:antibiotic biosynthesis monooxygenase family protein [Niallia sp. 01092]|uniref:antibiotic biosynthesis monooxygenase family protein n=1 Tax=unclassified Niallia TaxID=2837522 RepID=UPI003FD27613
MQIFIANGTYDFLEKKYEKYFSAENMLLMQSTNQDQATLVHESDGKSFFKTPRKFDILYSFGQLENKGYVVINHFSLEDISKPIFEHKTVQKLEISSKPYAAVRFLRSVKGDAYLVLSLWRDPDSFKQWESFASPQTFPIAGPIPDEWKIQQNNMFYSKSYVTYHIIPEEKK